MLILMLCDVINKDVRIYFYNCIYNALKKGFLFFPILVYIYFSRSENVWCIKCYKYVYCTVLDESILLKKTVVLGLQLIW